MLFGIPILHLESLNSFVILDLRSIIEYCKWVFQKWSGHLHLENITVAKKTVAKSVMIF